MADTEKLQRNIEKLKELTAKVEGSMEAVPQNQRETQAFALKVMQDELAHLTANLPEPATA